MTPASKSCPRCRTALRPVAGAADKWQCPACGTRCISRGKPDTSSGLGPWLPVLTIPAVALLLAVILLIVHHTRARPAMEAVAAAEEKPPPLPVPSTPTADPPQTQPRPPAPPAPVQQPPPQPNPYQPPTFPQLQIPLLQGTPPPSSPAPPAEASSPPKQPSQTAKANPPAAPKRPAGQPSSQDIDRSIDRGVAYLKARLADSFKSYGPLGPTGYRTGMFALAGLALLECGVPVEDPSVRQVAEQVRGSARKLTNPYEVSTTIWFLDRLGGEKDADLIRALALRLIAAQTSGGGWGYFCHPLTETEEDRLTRMLNEPPPADGSANLPPAVRFQPGQKLGPEDLRYDDNSSTQFAILALWAARKHGVPVERSLALVEHRFRTSQNRDGSWCYFSPHSLNGRHSHGSYGGRQDSMTCAGLLGLAVARGLGKPFSTPPPTVQDEAVTRALTYLGQRIGNANPVTEEERLRLQNRAEAAKRQQESFFNGLWRVQDLQELAYPAIRELFKLQDALEAVKGDAPELVALQRPIKEKMLRRFKELEPVLEKVKGIAGELQNIQPTGDHFKGRLVRAKAWGDLYYLWSVERMAVVYGLRTVAGKDWYAWGSSILVAAQNDDGSWADAFPGVVDTSFALLFLKRANVVKDLSKRLEFLGQIKDVMPAEINKGSKDEIKKGIAPDPAEPPSNPKPLSPGEIDKKR